MLLHLILSLSRALTRSDFGSNSLSSVTELAMTNALRERTCLRTESKGILRAGISKGSRVEEALSYNKIRGTWYEDSRIPFTESSTCLLESSRFISYTSFTKSELLSVVAWKMARSAAV